MNQTPVSPAMKDLANQLMSFEAAQSDVLEEDTNATCRVCEKLRRPLLVLTGAAGFSSLLHRSLALARREAPALNSVSVQPDGTLSGLLDDALEASPILIAHLLSLLYTFIGEALTLQLLQDIWPDLVLTGVACGKDSQ